MNCHDVLAYTTKREVTIERMTRENGSITKSISDSAYCVATDVSACRPSVRPYVRLSVCLSHVLVHPAKTVGQNEMPFGRDTGVVLSNNVLDRAPSPWEGEIWGSEPIFGLRNFSTESPL